MMYAETVILTRAITFSFLLDGNSSQFLTKLQGFTCKLVVMRFHATLLWNRINFDIQLKINLLLRDFGYSVLKGR